MKRKCYNYLLLVFIFSSAARISVAQVPDDTNGRLWRLCKVYGFAKYYHPNTCNVNWNNLMLPAIDSVIAAGSNAAFNTALLNLLNAAGTIPHATDPLINSNTVNKNAHFEWTDDPEFSQEVRDILDSIEINFRPVESCLVSYDDYYDPSYYGFVDFSKDSILNIPSFTYTIESNRLLVFFYYWNIINYFHPDKDLMDQDWDSTLHQFVPDFRQAADDEDFHLRFLNLVTYLNDSHGFTGSEIIDEFFGTFYAYLKIDFIENQSVVTKVGSAITGISLGDLVKKVDGVPIEVLRDSLRNYTPASNESSEERDLHDYYLLAGSQNSVMQLELQDSTGATYQQSLTRSEMSGDYLDWAFASSYLTYEVTDCGYGYVNMGKLLPSQILGMYNTLKNTPAIIFDIRNYPNGTLWDMLYYFLPSPQTWALFTVPDPNFPGWYFWYDNKYDAGNFSNPDAYTGKVIILCNAETQSQAEYTIMGLQQCANSYTIGSQTAGADGNISYIYLPGDLYTYWTSLGIYYPDTTTAQRVGVVIDTLVTPTIAGIRHGIDEVLAAALDCVTGIGSIENTSAFSVYPNPASDEIFFEGHLISGEQEEVSIFNPLGQLVMYEKMQVQTGGVLTLNISQLTAGIYIASFEGAHGELHTSKFQVMH